jgi:multiple sugar transport system ATP-binding protein
MNFLDFRGGLPRGTARVRLGASSIAVPELREDVAESDLILGVRPEDVRLADGGAVPAEVFGTEYLGTTQIVTLTTTHGSVRARLSAEIAVKRGERVGLDFRSDKLSLFDRASGRALRTVLMERATVHG